MTTKSDYRDWFQEHPPAFTNKIKKFKVFGDRLVVCMSESPQKFAKVEGQMWGVEMRIKDENAPTEFQSVDIDLNKPFHDQDEAEDYYQRLCSLAEDYTELARFMGGEE